MRACSRERFRPPRKKRRASGTPSAFRRSPTSSRFCSSSSSSRCLARRSLRAPSSRRSRTSSGPRHPGPGGGGGGGGNRTPEPPRKAELPDKNKITVPVAKPPKLEAPEPPKPEPVQQMNIPAQPIAQGRGSPAGSCDQCHQSGAALGAGTGGGAGTGTGTGSGSGQGSGLGPGTGGDFGGGAYRPGNGITLPRLISEVKPNYTRRGDARQDPGHRVPGSRGDGERIGRAGARPALARLDLRTRSRSRAHRQEVGIRSRHQTRAACSGRRSRSRCRSRCGKQPVDNLQSAICNLQSAIRNLQSAVCNLQCRSRRPSRQPGLRTPVPTSCP